MEACDRIKNGYAADFIFQGDIMETFTYVEIDAFALAVLAIIIVNVLYRSELYLFEQKLFLLMVSANAVMLVLDAVLWVLNGRAGPDMRQANILLTVLYYVVNPVPAALWALYADYLVYGSPVHTVRRILPFAVPLVLHTVISVMNYFGPYEFYFDSNNVYHRGPLFFLLSLICYLYLGATLLLVLFKRKQLDKDCFIPVLVYVLIPFAGGLIQSVCYGVSLIWICMCLSTLIIFVNSQHSRLNIDGLTGLSNRRLLDTYFQEVKRGRLGGKPIAGIMIDIDRFKQINDEYGHVAGDQALQHAAEILRSSFRKDDLIVRYGGDEFLIVLQVGDRPDIDSAVCRVKKNMEEFNRKRITPYEISFSIGYDLYNSDTMTTEQFVDHIDQLMYREKHEKQFRA